MPVIGTGDVQLIRIRKPFRIVICRSDHHQYHLSFRYCHSAKCEIFPGESLCRGLHRTVVAQQLFDTCGIDARIVVRAGNSPS
jgi:hypothetical protein